MRKRKFPFYTTSDKVFLALDWVLIIAFMVILVYPLLFVVAASLSANPTVMSLAIIPERFSTIGYKTVFSYKDIWTSYGNSLLYMVLGTAIALGLTICCAYPLSRKDLDGKWFFMGLCLITMYFSGGLIPSYIAMRNYRLLDSVWAVVLPGAMSVYNMIVMRTYFQTEIPDSLLESAQLDGCGNIRFLTAIVLPLSLPILAVISLFYAVDLWNSYFTPMVYLSSRSKYPLSMILREILISSSAAQESMMGDIEASMAREAQANVMRYAVIVVASLPVLIIYPFVQKYFIKGMMIGAIKG